MSLVAVAAVVSVAAIAAMHSSGRRAASQQDTNRAAAPPTGDTAGMETTARRIYPYSIVPGGVQNSTEVVRVMADDLTVAAHYAGIDPSRLRVEHVSGAQRAFVSYRKGAQVYWTSRAIALHDGEAILTDGVTTLRARCGNKLSDAPQQPVLADEPDPDAFESFEDPGEVRLLDLAFMPAGPAAFPLAVDEDDPGALLSVPLLMPSALSAPVDPAIGFSPRPPSQVQSVTPAPVPEPGTITLVGLGLAAAVRYARRRRTDQATESRE